MIEFYQALFKFFEESGKPKAGNGRQFIPRSREFSCTEMTVYVRATPRINQETRLYEKALVIARVDVQPELRGKKYFRDFLKHMDAQAYANGYNAIYVDQVHSDVLRECLPRYGFVRQTGTDPNEYIYRKAVRFDVAEQEEPEEHHLWMIRENRSMRYLSFVNAQGAPVTTSKGMRAIHYRCEETAQVMRDALQERASPGVSYSVIVSQTAARP